MRYRSTKPAPIIDWVVTHAKVFSSYDLRERRGTFRETLQPFTTMWSAFRWGSASGAMNNWQDAAKRPLSTSGFSSSPTLSKVYRHQETLPELRMKWLRQPVFLQSEGLSVTAPSSWTSHIQQGSASERRFDRRMAPHPHGHTIAA